MAGSWWRRRGRGGGVGVVVASGSWWRRGRGGVGVVVETAAAWLGKAASGVAPPLGSGSARDTHMGLSILNTKRPNRDGIKYT